VRRHFFAIALFLSAFLLIVHDAIPHHHFSLHEFESLSNIPADNHGQNETDNDHDQKNHFPFHQHAISDIDFVTGRYTILLNKVLKEYHQDLGSFSTFLPEFNVNTYFTGFIRVIKKPLFSNQFIIPLNTTRGSPFIS